jgi:putative restriction endonuclease
MDLSSPDAQLRQPAFSHVDRLATLRDGVLDSVDLAGGFDFGGERIPLINPQRGIFKPRQMAAVHPNRVPEEGRSGLV